MRLAKNKCIRCSGIILHCRHSIISCFCFCTSFSDKGGLLTACFSSSFPLYCYNLVQNKFLACLQLQMVSRAFGLELSSHLSSRICCLQALQYVQTGRKK